MNSYPHYYVLNGGCHVYRVCHIYRVCSAAARPEVLQSNGWKPAWQTTEKALRKGFIPAKRVTREQVIKALLRPTAPYHDWIRERMAELFPEDI